MAMALGQGNSEAVYPLERSCGVVCYQAAKRKQAMCEVQNNKPGCTVELLVCNQYIYNTANRVGYQFRPTPHLKMVSQPNNYQ